MDSGYCVIGSLICHRNRIAVASSHQEEKKGGVKRGEESETSLLIRWLDLRRQPWGSRVQRDRFVPRPSQSNRSCVIPPREERGVKRGWCIGSLAPDSLAQPQASFSGSRAQRDRLAPRSSLLNPVCRIPTRRKRGGVKKGYVSGTRTRWSVSFLRWCSGYRQPLCSEWARSHQGSGG